MWTAGCVGQGAGHAVRGERAGGAADLSGLVESSAGLVQQAELLEELEREAQRDIAEAYRQGMTYEEWVDE